MYSQLGFAYAPSLAAAIGAHLAARPRGARAAHRYSLGDTGLDATTERRRFARYQATYDVPDED